MTPVAAIVELQRKSIAAERAAIVAYIRKHAALSETLAREIERGAHLYDATLFEERTVTNA